MNYLIIGAGGTGGCIGAYLARMGHDVTLIARGEHLAAIRERGLKLRSVRIGNITLGGVRAVTAEEYTGTPDVIFVCVKYYSLPGIEPLLARAAGPDTLIIPVVNVFGTGGILAEKLPQAEILDGCIYITGFIGESGTVCQPSPIFRMFFGYRPGQPRRLEAKAHRTEADLCAAGIDAAFTETIEREALRKFSHVSPMGTAGLYFGAKAGDFCRAGAEQEAFLAMIGEITRLGHAMGVDVGEDLPETNLEIMRGLTPDTITSMQRDVAAGRQSEIDGLVHRIVRLGEKYGVPVPVYEKISRWAKETGIR